MAEQLILYQKVYDFVVWLYPVVNRIPKSHRMILGSKIERLSIRLLLSIVQANKVRGTQRKELHTKISDYLDCLRILIRLTKDLKFMSIKQYTVAAERLYTRILIKHKKK